MGRTTWVEGGGRQLASTAFHLDLKAATIFEMKIDGRVPFDVHAIQGDMRRQVDVDDPEQFASFQALEARVRRTESDEVAQGFGIDRPDRRNASMVVSRGRCGKQ